MRFLISSGFLPSISLGPIMVTRTTYERHMVTLGHKLAIINNPSDLGSETKSMSYIITADTL